MRACARSLGVARRSLDNPKKCHFQNVCILHWRRAATPSRRATAPPRHRTTAPSRRRATAPTSHNTTLLHLSTLHHLHETCITCIRPASPASDLNHRHHHACINRITRASHQRTWVMWPLVHQRANALLLCPSSKPGGATAYCLQVFDGTAPLAVRTPRGGDHGRDKKKHSKVRRASGAGSGPDGTRPPKQQSESRVVAAATAGEPVASFFFLIRSSPTSQR